MRLALITEKQARPHPEGGLCFVSCILFEVFSREGNLGAISGKLLEGIELEDLVWN